MQKGCVTRSSLLGGLLLLGMTTPAEAIDLTGAWQGPLVCQVSTPGQSVDQQKSRAITLSISLTGPFLTAKLSLFDGEPVFFLGKVVEKEGTAMTGQLVATVCAGNLRSAMTATVSQINPVTGQGELHGTLFFFTSETVGVCTVSGTRMSQEDPHVPSCF